MLIGIIKNEDPDSVYKWELACEKLGLDFLVIDMTAGDWLAQVNSKPFDFFLIRPPGRSERYKVLFDERLYILSKVLGKKTFPSFEEVIVYENKKMLSYYLEALNIPHPKTWVFYNKNEARSFIEKVDLPIVGKTSIGASGSGVEVFKSIPKLEKYIDKAFSAKGIKRRFGPNRATGTPKKWISKALKSPDYFKRKLKDYISVYKDGQRGYVIFQEFIPHEYEWRMVKIGDSYFGHQKIKQGEKASGTKGIDYVRPPRKLLDFTKKICDENQFNSMAIDVFEHPEKGYVINELQTIFGHVQDYILAVDGIPGRFIIKNGEWIFEEGDFNTNESYDLRVKAALELYGTKK